jgi:hypothetical protein
MTCQSANGMKISNKYLRLTSCEGGQVTALEPKRPKKRVKKRYRERELGGKKKEEGRGAGHST